MVVMCCIVLYVRGNCFVVDVSRMYINIFYRYVLRYVCCSKCYLVSKKCDWPTPCLVKLIGAHGREVKYFWNFCFRGELDFLNCDGICMCVVNKQFWLLEFVFTSVCVKLKYN